MYASADAKSLVTLTLEQDHGDDEDDKEKAPISVTPRRITNKLSGSRDTSIFFNPMTASATTTTATITTSRSINEGDVMAVGAAPEDDDDDDDSSGAGIFTPDDTETFRFVDETPSPPPPTAPLQTPTHEVDAIEAAKRELLICEIPDYSCSTPSPS